MLSKQEMTGYYDTMELADPRRFMQRFNPGIINHPVLAYFIRLKLDLLKRHLARKPGRLLDIGCGTGFYFPLLSRYADRIVAVDNSRAMLRTARSLVGEKKLSRITVREMDVEAMDFPGSSFDAVLALDVLHHTADIPAVLEEVHRVLRKGGLFLAVEVNPLNPLALIHNLLRREERGVLRTFPAMLEGMLRRRFSVLRTEYLQYWPYFPVKTPARSLPFIRAIEAFLSKTPVLSRLSVYYAVACLKAD